MRHGLGEPGSVDEHVQRLPAPRPHRLAQREQRGGVGDLGRHRQMAAAGQRVRERDGGLGRARGVGDDDAGAGVGEKSGARRSDAARTADDEGESAVEELCHGPASYLIGGMGRLASPGRMTKV